MIDASPFLIFLGALVALFILEKVAVVFVYMFGICAVVEEREAQIYVLFGNVLGVIQEPGLHFLWSELGLGAAIVNIFGQRITVDLRLDQNYLRSNPVNSEEGAPMGIGVWYEMNVFNALAHVFRNTDPEGSLAANLGNATVKCLSNLPLASMLQDRHSMSRAVRDEVSPHVSDWGYQLGSVYIRKVHFRNSGMIHQIEEKVVNRLKQVTAAIKQDGLNQVNIITSQAEKEAAVAFAQAAVVRSEIVGGTIESISEDPEVSSALFDILEMQRLIQAKPELTLIPDLAAGDSFLGQMLAVDSGVRVAPVVSNAPRDAQSSGSP